jgi:hypothetical protein
MTSHVEENIEMLDVASDQYKVSQFDVWSMYS